MSRKGTVAGLCFEHWISFAVNPYAVDEQRKIARDVLQQVWHKDWREFTYDIFGGVYPSDSFLLEILPFLQKSLKNMLGRWETPEKPYCLDQRRSVFSKMDDWGVPV